MKLKDVPQDLDPTYQGQKKLMYAVDDKGKIVTAPSSGWQVEETVKSLAWKMIGDDLAVVADEVRAGRSSPLKYFMKLRQMEPGLLAGNMGISGLRVRWHLRPRVFTRLSDWWIERYSHCLEIPVERLKNFQEAQ